MSDIKRQEFQDRIARLEARKQAEAEAYLAENPTVARETRSQFPLLLGLFAACFLALGVAVTLPYALKMANDYREDVAAVIPMSGPKLASMAKRERPNSIFRHQRDNLEHTGMYFGSASVATAAGGSAPLESLVPLSDVANDDGVFASVSPFQRTMSSCQLRRPLKAERFYSVNVERSRAEAAVSVLSDARLAKALIKKLGAGDDPISGANDRGLRALQPGLVNLFITDTSAPLYLVLQSFSEVIWNLSLAEGVTIAHVSLIGEAGQGAVNLPGGTTMEALRISDFVSEHRFGDDDVVRPCMIRPWRKPRTDWPAAQKAAEAPGSKSNLMQNYQLGQAAYEAWFGQTFGTSTETGEHDVAGAQHVLVGPAEGAVYAPVSGAHLWIDDHDHIFIGNEAQRAEAAAVAVTELLERASGDDISALYPEVQERVGQVQKVQQ